MARKKVCIKVEFHDLFCLPPYTHIFLPLKLRRKRKEKKTLVRPIRFRERALNFYCTYTIFGGVVRMKICFFLQRDAKTHSHTYMFYNEKNIPYHPSISFLIDLRLKSNKKWALLQSYSAETQKSFDRKQKLSAVYT